MGRHDVSKIYTVLKEGITFCNKVYINPCCILPKYQPGPEVQSVASPTADSGITSSIPTRFHTFVAIDHEIISTVILLLPLIQEGLLSVTSTVGQVCPEKKVWLGDLTVST